MFLRLKHSAATSSCLPAAIRFIDSSQHSLTNPSGNQLVLPVAAQEVIAAESGDPSQAAGLLIWFDVCCTLLKAVAVMWKPLMGPYATVLPEGPEGPVEGDHLISFDTIRGQKSSQRLHRRKHPGLDFVEGNSKVPQGTHHDQLYCSSPKALPRVLAKHLVCYHRNQM